jgi:Periplasmic binding protein-like domain
MSGFGAAQYVIDGGTGDETGYRAMKDLLALKRPPDGVFCYNDPVAAGAIKAVLETGLKIPQDVAIIGAGNVHYSDLLRVPLSTRWIKARPRLVKPLHTDPGGMHTGKTTARTSLCTDSAPACDPGVQPTPLAPQFRGVCRSAVLRGQGAVARCRVTAKLLTGAIRCSGT